MFEKVIVADGDVEIRSRFYDILTGMAYKADLVPNGNELLRAMRHERPSLVILDDDLPTEGAVDAIKKIREFDTDIAIVVVTANQSRIGLLEKLPIGIKAAVFKDFSTHQMMKRILELLKENKLKMERESRKGNILVVDDDVEVRSLMTEFLGRKGYSVVAVSSGQEALDEIKNRVPDLVLLDIRMPGMDGLVVMRNIRVINKSLKVVILTAIHDKDIVKDAFKEGALDYLIKPFDLHKLDALVMSLLIPQKPNR
ncbi:MAG: response regulator [Candidatus Omnitrophota bacterium]